MTNSVNQVKNLITVLQWNCRSIIPKFDLFNQLVNISNCDAFALCETFLNSNDELNFHNFNIIRQDRGSYGGGVLLGIKKCYSFFRIDLPSIPNIEVVAIQTKLKGKDLCVASIYIPPSARIEQRQLSAIAELLPAPFLILGDFNSHCTQWGSLYDDNRSSVICTFIDDFDLTFLNTGEATRVPNPPARKSVLDLSLCSTSLALDCEWKVINDPHGSDHLPIKISITNGSSSSNSINVAYDLTRNIDWKCYARVISEVIESREELPPEEEYALLSGLILDAATQAQTKPIPGDRINRRPPTNWWDKECSDLYELRSSAYKDFRTSGKIDMLRKYEVLDRQMKNLMKAKKRGYWRRFVNGLTRETAMSTLWSTARRMRNRNVTNESEEYSSRWIFDFAKKVCPDSVPDLKNFRDATLTNTNEPPFSMSEFSIALLSCNNNAPGLDRIKFNLLKNLPDSAKRRLLNLFNKFLEYNIVPQDWRDVKVIAIRKPGKPASDHNSYRPIAMLSCIRKLMEKIILFRLDKWVETNGLLSDTQFGFRRGKGTNDCLAMLSTEIQLAYAHKEQMASVFLDIKGAFDSVSVEVLTEKLHLRGLSPNLNNFLHNLLSEKRMLFSHSDSTTSRISYMGLPQGSCLSPLLYNFYVNDIDECLANSCTLKQLADDSVVSYTGSSATDLQRPLQDTLDNLSTWALKLGIEFSPEKTELVVFTRKHNPAQLQLRLMGETISQVLVAKYLGVWFDSKCTWACHIRNLNQKCQQRISFLRTITGTWWGAHPRDLIRLYQTTILSVLEYGCFCFRSAANTHIIKLERIQYRCLRIALGCMQSTHTMSLEVLSGVLPLKYRFWELSYRLLVRCVIMNPLVIENFERLVELQFQSRFMTLYLDFMAQDINPSSHTSLSAALLDTSHSAIFFDISMKEETYGIPDQMRSQEIPKIFFNKFKNVSCDKMFFTDGSNLDQSTGFGVFHRDFTASYKLDAPASVYVGELAAIQYSLGIIETMPIDHYFIFTDSLSAIEALRSMKTVKHSPYFLGKIRELLSALTEQNYKVTLVWVPSHCAIPGNERADSLAKVGAIEGEIYDRPIAYNEYFSILRQSTLTGWQSSWDADDLGRWLHSIVPKVSTKAWFKGLDVSRDFIRVMSRLMSNHYTLNSHLFRIKLAESNHCVCGDGYHDIEHVIWSCSEYCGVRSQLSDSLRARGRQPNVPIRDILASRDLQYMTLIYKFLKAINAQI